MSTGLTLPHAFHRPLPAPNIRILAVTYTGRQDAGGSCPELSSQKETSLEDSFLLARSDGHETIAALKGGTFHEYRSTAPGDTFQACIIPLASHKLLTNVSGEDVQNSFCRQCRTVRDWV